MKEVKKCLHPDCNDRAYVRGLCVFDYRVACGLVKRGVTTWEALESNGKCLAPKPRGRKRDSTGWFLGGGQ